MQTLRRTVALLIFPAIAYLGAGCDRTDTPTGAPSRPVATVGGPTCNVPADYPTIQAAVNDPGCTTIDVAPGLYIENVVIGRTLTLNGAQAGNPVAGRVSGSPLESTVQGANPIGGNPVITINAASVTIDGFTLRNPITTGAATGIAINTPGNSALITNNIVDGISTVDVSSNGAAQAVYLANGPDNVRILGNDLKNVQSARSAKGVHIGDAASTNPSTGILVEGNSIENITSTVRGAYGVSINNGNGTTANSGLVIQNNTITNLIGGGWVHAIGLETNTPGVFVTGNTINPLVSPSTDAVAVWFEANPSYATGHVNQNNFDVTIAAYGIAVQATIPGTGSVDGTCNWWGDPNGPGPVGPGAGAKVSPRVDYTPWLTAPAPSGPCIGGVPSGKVTGGGQVQVNITGGKGSFGFNAKNEAGVGGSGHLNYLNHATRAHLDCTVTLVTVLTATTAEFSGPCSPNSAATSFRAHVEDNGKPGKNNNDKFKITYTDQFGPHVDEGGPGPIVSGNIEIHQ